jgi:tryptophan halogenase
MQRVTNITIVGGGTSAWLTAAFLSARGLNVTVIDKEIGTPIGVGEATLLGFASFMNDCGFEFEDWFTHCDTTFKAGISYPDWVTKDNEVWAPFNLSPLIDDSIRMQDAWSHAQNLDFKTRGTCMYEVSKQNKIDTSVMETYAFHVDAGKLVTYIQDRIKHRCNLINSDVVSVIRNKNKVEGVKLKDGRLISSDLFIDCTGMNSIINDVEYQSLYGRLFCNTALAHPVQYIDKQNEMHPYTKAVAVDHGWIWITPTASRIGSGLVFDKNITSVDIAKDFFVNFWDGRIDKDKIRVLDWTPQYTKTPWVGNVVSIGLSAGFIEPLESTGIALIISQARQLHDRIADFYYTDDSISLYNHQFTEGFESSVDFVSSHYSNTERTEPFWQNVKNNYVKTSTLQLKQDLLKSGPLYSEHKKSGHLFTGANWTTWLVALGNKIGSTTNINPEHAQTALNNYYNVVEKYREISGVDHMQEVNRIQLYARTYLNNND